LFDPATLTGAVVREVRDQHRLSRVEFCRRAGFTGKSTARLSNIETRNSWKPGDREAVARVLNELAPNFDPRYMPGGDLVVRQESSPNGAVVDRPEYPIVPVDLDGDDVDDALLSVGHPPVAHVTSAPVADAVDVAPPVVVREGSYPVSNSELQTWKRCRRKWWLAWYRRLALRTETFVGVRSVGDRIHRALERWYVPDGTPRVDPRDALERVIVEDWTKIDRLARTRDVGEERLAELAREFARSTNLERAMVEGYVQWLEETGADAELRVIAAETPLAAELELYPNTEDERTITVIGKLDVRVRRVTDDVNLLLDHKTVGDLKSPAVTLPQNEQMLHYVLLEWLQTDDGEARCDGALYNMLKRSQRTTRATPPFYDRVEVRHNRFELESYRRRLLATSRDVLDAVVRLDRGEEHLDVVYPSPRGECKWDCDFFAVCNLIDDGSAGTDDMIDALYHEVDPRDRYDVRSTDE
jgi:hypothetical protein